MFFAVAAVCVSVSSVSLANDTAHIMIVAVGLIFIVAVFVAMILNTLNSSVVLDRGIISLFSPIRSQEVAVTSVRSIAVVRYRRGKIKCIKVFTDQVQLTLDGFENMKEFLEELIPCLPEHSSKVELKCMDRWLALFISTVALILPYVILDTFFLHVSERMHFAGSIVVWMISGFVFVACLRRRRKIAAVVCVLFVLTTILSVLLAWIGT